MQIILGHEQEGPMVYTAPAVGGVDAGLLRAGEWVPGSGPCEGAVCEELPPEPVLGLLLPDCWVVSQGQDLLLKTLPSSSLPPSSEAWTQRRC